MVGRSGDTPIRLADVADVVRGNADRQVIMRVNGKEGVQLDIYREGDANLVNLSRKVMARAYPKGDTDVATPEMWKERQEASAAAEKEKQKNNEKEK